MTTSSRNSNSFRVTKKRSLMRADWFLPRFGCFCFGLRSCVSVFSWCFATASFGCIVLSIIFSARAYELDKFINVDDIESKKRELWVLTGSLLMYGLVSLPLGILVLQGALQGRRTLLVPWLCAAGLTVLIVLPLLILMKSVLRWQVTLAISVALVKWSIAFEARVCCTVLCVPFPLPKSKVSERAGVLVFAWIHVFSLFYRLRPRSPRRYSVRFSLQTNSDNADLKLSETTGFVERPNTWPTRAQVVEDKVSVHASALIRTEKRIDTLRPVPKGHAVPSAHRNARFQRQHRLLNDCRVTKT